VTPPLDEADLVTLAQRSAILSIAASIVRIALVFSMGAFFGAALSSLRISYSGAQAAHAVIVGANIALLWTPMEFIAIASIPHSNRRFDERLARSIRAARRIRRGMSAMLMLLGGAAIVIAFRLYSLGEGNAAPYALVGAVLCLVGPALASVLSGHTSPDLFTSVLCPACGYNCAGGACPECGRVPRRDTPGAHA